jgi:probable phosphoglycerate mutase
MTPDDEPGAEVVLARHGETEWSRDMRHTGRTDVPLTERGREQAAALAPRLAERGFARVLVSPLSRAVETCELAGLGGRAERTDALLEFDYGDAEGKTTAQMRERVPDWTVWTHSTPGAETPDDVGARLAPLVAELVRADGDVAVFAHGHVLRVLAALWIESEPVEGSRFALSTGTLSTLGWERDARVFRAWNA